MDTGRMTFEERVIFVAWCQMVLPQAADVSGWDRPFEMGKAG